MNLFYILGSALGFQIECVYSVDFVPPQLNPDRPWHIRCVKVDNIATHRKLAWAFHHITADISGIYKFLAEFRRV